MNSEIPIPNWLKQKNADRREETPEKSGKFVPAIMIGTLVSYFGLMALERAKTDERDTSMEKSPAKIEPNHVAGFVPAQQKNENARPALRELTDRDLESMDPVLEAVYRRAERVKASDACESKSNPRFDKKKLIYPFRYSDTLCYAQTSRDLFSVTQDRQYLEVSEYYYKRCLYLIEGQMRGVFRRPKGGEEEIRRRQREVYIALDSINERD